jgi:hypothetical protein
MVFGNNRVVTKICPRASNVTNDCNGYDGSSKGSGGKEGQMIGGE